MGANSEGGVRPGKPRRRASRADLLHAAASAVPWLLCFALLALGLALWFVSAGAANQRLEGAVAELGLRATPEGAAVLPRARCAPRAALSAAGAAGAWLLVFAAAGLACIYGAWLASAAGGDALLDMAAAPLKGAEQAAAAGAAAVAAAVGELAAQARGALTDAPRNVTVTEWHKQALKRVNGVLAEVATPPDEQPPGSCPTGCAALAAALPPAAAAGGGGPGSGSAIPKCLCFAATAAQLRGSVRAMGAALLPAVGGLGLVLLAGTWLLACGAAASAMARRELKDRRKGLPRIEEGHTPECFVPECMVPECRASDSSQRSWPGQGHLHSRAAERSPRPPRQDDAGQGFNV
ncbi:MAG: hypothetical protein J3K34DRAFT_520220 [Monoraphidium minutum]|nr:MAG: hypothetical protein J3K34DRAFT_520220 [Monoraphidium minutum]